MNNNKITNSIINVGVVDNNIDLFEGQYKVPNGMKYNSYIILDDKIAVFDTVDSDFTHDWLDNLSSTLGSRQPDYLIVQHMEPDHSGNVEKFINYYPNSKIVVNSKTLVMLKQFFNFDVDNRAILVENGQTLSLGKHTLQFYFAPMVHWPEVMMTYDVTEKTLFSADAFGKFGASDNEEWLTEARRYYIGIVGKYGTQVQNVLKKLSSLQVDIICPLHGPVLKDNISSYIKAYDTWSSYQPEEDGIVIAYSSVYGNTKNAVLKLENMLKQKGASKIAIYDLARTDMSYVVAESFRYSKLVLATTTYNADIFPFMNEFIDHLTERNYQNRTVAIIENGSWAPIAIKVIKEKLSKSKNISFTENMVTIKSAVKKETLEALELLSDELCVDYIARSSDKADKNNLKALFNIGYGLYVVTSSDGKKDNGLIVNTVSQVADNPNRICVVINKSNYSHHIIKQSGKMNVNCLSVEAPFSVFKNFGFVSGRNHNKFADYETYRADNGLVFLANYINSFMSLNVEQYLDIGSHGMFICSVSEARVINDKETMTYAYYHKNVKPKPETEGKKGYVCEICGYIFEGNDMPDDFQCPLCKHGKSDFKKLV